MLTTDQARAFYDRFGEKQDRQAFYEDQAIDALVAGAELERAAAVVELGCGTGRLAELLLRKHLPETASYRGFDLSSTMVELARRRLADFSDRATVEQTGGGMRFDLEHGGCDRFVSTYVADLLPDTEVAALIAEAHRLLAPSGCLCLAGLTAGETRPAKLITAVWRGVHRLRPAWVGGCRPLEMRPLLQATAWEVVHHLKVAPWGMTSEVLVARKRP